MSEWQLKSNIYCELLSKKLESYYHLFVSDKHPIYVSEGVPSQPQATTQEWLQSLVLRADPGRGSAFFIPPVCPHLPPQGIVFLGSRSLEQFDGSHKASFKFNKRIEQKSQGPF